MRFFQCVTLAGVLLTMAASLEAAPSARNRRLSVLDYYFLLPAIGNAGYPTQRERQDLLKPDPEVGPVIDLRHDYLSVQPDSSPREQIAVFRGNGPDVIAQSAPDDQSDYNRFALYQLRQGRLRDVTKRLLPVPARDDRFLYELPRLGTTIHVFTFDLEKQSHHPAFDLQWREGHFIKVNLKRATY